MRLLLAVALVTAVVACCGPHSAPPHTTDAKQSGDTDPSPQSLRIDEHAVAVEFPQDRIDLVINDWNESKKRLRFSRGCILLVGSLDGPVDGAAALTSGTYPVGDDQYLDLACIELSRAADDSELVVTSRADRGAGMERVVTWLEGLGGVVVARDGKRR